METTLIYKTSIEESAYTLYMVLHT